MTVFVKCACGRMALVADPRHAAITVRRCAKCGTGEGKP